MNTANFPHARERKQAEALVRQAASAALTPAQRLAALDKHGFRAVKERAKLQRRAERAATTAPAPMAVMVLHGPDTLAAPAEPQAKPRRKGRDEKRGARR